MELFTIIAHTGHRHAQESASMMSTPLIIAVVVVSIGVVVGAMFISYKASVRTRIKQQADFFKDSKTSK